MVTRAQADKTRAEAARDVRADGARVTVLYDPRQVDAATGAKAGPPPVSVKTWAILGGYRANLVDGERIRQGDLNVIVADVTLRGLSLDPLLALDGTAPTGYWIYLPNDPEQHPEPTDPPPAGVRRLAVVRLADTVFEGAYPVLRMLQCRG